MSDPPFKIPEGVTFAEFIQALKDLEAAGKIRVVKWPRDEHDRLHVRMLTDKDGNPNLKALS